MTGGNLKVPGSEGDFRFVNSQGHCLLCLVKLVPRSSTSMMSVTSTSSISSLQCLSHYLKMDLGKVKVCNQTNGKKGEGEGSKLKMELCEECTTLNDKFLGLYRQLQEIEKEVASCLEQLRGRLAPAEESGRVEQFRMACSSSEVEFGVGGAGRKEDLDVVKVVEAVRKEALEKCSHKLDSFSFIPRESFESRKRPAPTSTAKETEMKRSRVDVTRPPKPHPPAMEAQVGQRQVQEPGGITEFKFVFDPEEEEESMDDDIDNDNGDARGYDHGNSPSENYRIITAVAPPITPIIPVPVTDPFLDNLFNPVTMNPRPSPPTERFQCSLCPKYFPSDDSLQDHYKSGHTLSEGRPYLRSYSGSSVPRRGTTQLLNPNIAIPTPTGPCPGGIIHPPHDHDHASFMGYPAPENNPPNLRILPSEIIMTDAPTKLDPEVIMLDEDYSSNASSDNDTDYFQPRSQPVPPQHSSHSVKKGLGSRGTVQFTVTPPVSQVPPSQSQGQDGRPFTIDPLTGHYICNVCSKVFEKYHPFWMHQKIQHPKSRFKCNACGMTFNTQTDYKKHHQSSHANLRFRCPHCPKSFVMQGHLTKHLNSGECEGGAGLGYQS